MMATITTTTAITTGVTSELEPDPSERSVLDKFLLPELGPTVLTRGTTKRKIHTNVGRFLQKRNLRLSELKGGMKLLGTLPVVTPDVKTGTH